MRHVSTVKLTVGVASIIVLALVVFGGALLRGPVLRGVVGQLSSTLCGEVSVAGGRLSWYAIPALAAGWPVDLVLDDLRVATSRGDDVLRFGHVRAVVDVDWRARRITVPTLVARDGAWVLDSVGPDRPPRLIQAFRSQPDHDDPRACNEPRPTPPSPPDRDVARWTMSLPFVEFEDLDVTFSYPAWGLTLLDTDAHGWLAIPDGGDAMTLFEVRGAYAAGGGTLRIGPRGNPAVPVFPFDEVSIARVAVEKEHPRDLVLEVAAGWTGEAHLAGRAVFRGVFSAPGAGNDEDAEAAGGMDLRARWTAFGDALVPALSGAGIELPRRPRGWGDLAVDLDGPYARLTGKVALRAPDVDVRVRLDDGRRIGLRTRFARFETAAWMPPRWRAALAGRLDGSLAAHVAIGDEPADLRATLDMAALDYRRGVRTQLGAEPSPWLEALLPSTLSLRAGAQAAGRARVGPEGAIVRVDRAHVFRGRVRVAGLRARAPGLALAASGQAQVIAAGRHNPAQRRDPDVQVHVARAWVDLERLLPGGVVSGTLAFAGRIAGSPDRLAVALERRSGWLRVRDRRFAPVGAIRLRVRPADAVMLDRLHLDVVPGGIVTAQGRVGADGDIDVRLGARRFAFADLLGDAARIPIPPAAGDAAPEIDGRLDALVSVTGRLPRPTLDGWVLVSDVRFGDRPLGDGGFEILTLADGEGYRVRGGLLQGFVRADVAFLFDEPRGTRGTIDVARFPLAPLLPTPARAVDPVASGHAHFAVRRGEPRRISGTLAIEARGLDLATRATVTGDAVDATVTGRWRGDLRLPGARLAGVVDIASHVGGALASPTIDGYVDVRRATALVENRTVPLVRAHGTIGFARMPRGFSISTTGFEVALGFRLTPVSGTIRVGNADSPARVHVTSLVPLRFGSVHAPIQGWHVSYDPPSGKVTVDDLHFELVLQKDGVRRPTLRGRVGVDHVVFDPRATTTAERRALPSNVADFAERLELDIALVAHAALDVKIPVLPDPTIGFACRVRGTAALPSLSGRVRGSGVYSSILVRLYDHVSDRDVRRCGVI